MPLMELRISCWARRLVLVMAVLVCSIAAGVVHNLGDADFDQFVDNLPEDALLVVDFHKPGCRQCQRLSPVLDYLETEWENEEPDASKRWFKLAKVDVEKSPRLKTVFGIQRIPDLRFVRAGQWGTYEGGRLIEDIKEFKKRMAIVPLRFVDGKALIDLAEENEVVFVLSAEDDADPSTVAPGVLLAATQLQHMTTFCTTSPEVLSSLGLGASSVSPALVKVVASAATGAPDAKKLLQPTAYPGSGVSSVADVSAWSVSRWVEQERFGLVSNFSVDNFSRLGALGRHMVLGVVDPKHEKTAAFEQAFGKIASSFGTRHADKLIFGMVNRKQMSGFMETFNIYEGHPRVVVLDMPGDVYYTAENMRLGAQEIEAFLVDVLAGFIPARIPSTNSARYIMRIWWGIQNGGAWSFLLLIPVVGLLWVFCDTPQREEAREALRQSRRANNKERDQSLGLKED
ncbi:unnamed protein product [Scytosiphon promiscuus]